MVADSGWYWRIWINEIENDKAGAILKEGFAGLRGALPANPSFGMKTTRILKDVFLQHTPHLRRNSPVFDVGIRIITLCQGKVSGIT